jgi:hypothetical protein
LGTEPKQYAASLVTSEKDFYELLTSPGTEVTNLIVPDDDVVWVSCKYSDENVATGKNVNVAVAAYVTTKSRLKMYDYLKELSEAVLYCDTDSVIYIQKGDESPKVNTGNCLGNLTD